MLTEHNEVKFKDTKGKNDVLCEINLPDENMNTIKMTMGGLTSFIKIKDFYTVCLMLVKGKQIERLFPIHERKVKKYKRQIKLIAQKDIKKGEQIIVTYEVDVPQVIKENGIQKIAEKRY